jgi:signal transduction histidine kinase/ActR/RegA family two-component response regulator
MRTGDVAAVLGFKAPDLSASGRKSLLAVSLVIGFLVTSYIGLGIVKYPSGAPADWMSSSFLICAMVMLGGRLRLASVAACIIGVFIIALLAHWPLLNAIIFTVMTTAESVLASWLLLRLSGTPRLANIKQAARLLFLVILPTTLVSSLVAGVACQLIYGRGFAFLTAQWFAGHGLGMALSLPTLLVLATPDNTAPPKRHPIETAILVTSLLAFASAPFNALSNVTFLLILPAATVLAFRLGVKMTVSSILVISTIGDLFYYQHPNANTWGTPLSIATLILIGQLYNLAVYLNGLLTGLAVNYQARLKEQLERRTAIARSARARALTASRAKTDFLATMSHEIRTPLNGVIGFTQVLLRGGDLAPDARRQVELIGSSGQALLTVVNDILDFSKVEAGEVVLNLRPAHLAAVCDEVCAIVRAEAGRKGLDLILAFDGPKDLLHAVDDQRLKQILFNLLNNAIKFTAAGSVTLAVSSRGERLRFEVRDTGPGIAPDAVPHLFDRFSQADSSISRSFGGTGLGLAISKGLVGLMGGGIGVETELGRGSVFWFEIALPIAAAPTRDEAPVVTDDDGALGPAAHVLLVDDHPVNRQLGMTVMTLLGCTVDLAENGLEAVEAARTRRYDLILMDVHMPVMDGIEATRAIRALDGPAGRVPIISMSADVMSDQLARAFAAGMNDSVSKPIEIENIQACLGKWIGRDAEGQSIAA